MQTVCNLNSPAAGRAAPVREIARILIPVPGDGEPCSSRTQVRDGCARTIPRRCLHKVRWQWRLHTTYTKTPRSCTTSTRMTGRGGRFTESLRRNVFVVHMIDILGARARKLNEDYFCRWGMTWCCICRCRRPSICDGRAARSGYRRRGTMPCISCCRWIGWGLDASSGLLPVTRMVLACLKIGAG
jgi:hypothetical protein